MDGVRLAHADAPALKRGPSFNSRLVAPEGDFGHRIQAPEHTHDLGVIGAAAGVELIGLCFGRLFGVKDERLHQVRLRRLGLGSVVSAAIRSVCVTGPADCLNSHGRVSAEWCAVWAKMEGGLRVHRLREEIHGATSHILDHLWRYTMALDDCETHLGHGFVPLGCHHFPSRIIMIGRIGKCTDVDDWEARIRVGGVGGAAAVVHTHQREQCRSRREKVARLQLRTRIGVAVNAAPKCGCRGLGCVKAECQRPDFLPVYFWSGRLQPDNWRNLGTRPIREAPSSPACSCNKC